MADRRLRPRARGLLAALLVSGVLPGCAGGPIARQIASSLAMQVADKITGQILDGPPAEERGQTNRLLMNAHFDPYQAAFLRAQLVAPTPDPTPMAPPDPKPDPIASAAPVISRLETVEIWGLIVGEEKQAMLTSMQQIGISIAPAQSEWERWQLAEGSAQEQKNVPLLVLIPPELGKMKSGDHAVVEIASGGLHIARERLD